jgi:hypothetical protein
MHSSSFYRAVLPTLALSALCLSAPLSAGEVIGEDLNEEDNQEYTSLPRLRLSIETGYSQWLFNPDSTSDSYDGYLNDLERGQSTAAEIAYFFWPRGGIGLNWIWFVSRAKGTGIEVRTGDGSSHSLRDRVSVTYIGPDFLTRLHLSQYALVVAGFGAGYLEFLNTGFQDLNVFEIKAHNFAVLTHVGVEYSLMRLAAVGLEGRFVFSNIREYTYNGKKYRVNDPEDKWTFYNIPLYRLEVNAALHLML